MAAKARKPPPKKKLQKTKPKFIAKKKSTSKKPSPRRKVPLSRIRVGKHLTVTLTSDCTTHYVTIQRIDVNATPPMYCSRLVEGCSFSIWNIVEPQTTIEDGYELRITIFPIVEDDRTSNIKVVTHKYEGPTKTTPSRKKKKLLLNPAVVTSPVAQALAVKEPSDLHVLGPEEALPDDIVSIPHSRRGRILRVIRRFLSRIKLLPEAREEIRPVTLIADAVQ